MVCVAFGTEQGVGNEIGLFVFTAGGLATIFELEAADAAGWVEWDDVDANGGIERNVDIATLLSIAEDFDALVLNSEAYSRIDAIVLLVSMSVHASGATGCLRRSTCLTISSPEMVRQL